jgi:hypothetical protein
MRVDAHAGLGAITAVTMRARMSTVELLHELGRIALTSTPVAHRQRKGEAATRSAPLCHARSGESVVADTTYWLAPASVATKAPAVVARPRQRRPLSSVALGRSGFSRVA